MGRGAMIDAIVDMWHTSKFKEASEYDVIDISDVHIVEVAGAGLERMRMRGASLAYQSLEHVESSVRHPDQCVIDYLVWEASKTTSRKFTRWTRPWLLRELGEAPNTEELLAFVKKEGDVSMYALDMTMRVFETHVPECVARVSLFFVANNEHCYPITDKVHRQYIAQHGALSLHDIRVNQSGIEDADVRSSDDLNSDAAVIVVSDEDNLTAICVSMIEKSESAVESFSYYDGCLNAFQHPTKKQVVVAGRDYHERKAVCDTFFAKYRLADFRFANQQWGSIGRILFQSAYANIPRSCYSPDFKHVLTHYPVGPYISCEDTNTTARSVDISRCYSSILVNNKEEWGVFSGFESIEPVRVLSSSSIKTGEYYIRTSFTMGDIRVSRGFYPSVLVRYALQKRYINGSDITHAILAKRTLPGNTFRKFVEETTEAFPVESKSIINHYIGSLGVLYDKKEVGGITDNMDVAVATMLTCENDDWTSVFHRINDLIVVRRLKETMKHEGDLPLYRHILVSSWIELDKLRMAIYMKGIRMVGYTVDAVKFKGPVNESSFVKLADKVVGPKALGSYHEEKCMTLRGRKLCERPEHAEYVYTPLEVADVREANEIGDGGCLVNGEGGAGKSYTLAHIKKEDDIILCHTNIACENLKEQGVDAQTFDSFLTTHTGNWDWTRLKNHKRVLIDEYTTLAPPYMFAVLKAVQEFGLKVVCFGDPNQCHAPVDDWVRWDQNSTFLKMVGARKLTLAYKFMRYDHAMYERLCEFKKTRVLHWDNPLVPSYTNLCRTHETRHRINQDCLERWAHETGAVLQCVGKLLLNKENHIYGEWRAAVGLEVMAYNDSIKDKGIFTTQRWKVIAIEKGIQLERNEKTIWLDKKVFCKIFDYSFCCNIEKVQGCEFEGHINIHEADKMTFNMLYTALTRGKSITKVHVGARCSGEYPVDEDKVNVRAKKTEVCTRTGRIYMITCSGGETYVGQTEKSIERRLEEHLEAPTNEGMRAALAAGPARIELLEEFKYREKAVINRIEDEWIQKKKCLTMKNVQHNRAKEASVRAPAAQRKRIALVPADEEKYKRFRVRAKSKALGTIDEKLYYTKVAKDVALQQAQAFCERQLSALY